MPCSVFDMHCHLDFFERPAHAAVALNDAGVAALNATVTPAGFERAAAVLADAPNVRVGVGLHPWWIADGSCGPAEVERAAELAEVTRYVAEIGLDFAHGRDTSASAQVTALDCILSACENGGHVLSIHAVRAAGTALDALERHDTLARNVAILHWFSGTGDELHRAVKLGCHFSVGPRMLATRRGREYARQVPLPQLLLETDLPGSADEGRELSPRELADQLAAALEVLTELHGPESAEVIAHSSAELLQM